MSNVNIMFLVIHIQYVNEFVQNTVGIMILNIRFLVPTLSLIYVPYLQLTRTHHSLHVLEEHQCPIFKSCTVHSNITTHTLIISLSQTLLLHASCIHYYCSSSLPPEYFAKRFTCSSESHGEELVLYTVQWNPTSTSPATYAFLNSKKY